MKFIWNAIHLLNPLLLNEFIWMRIWCVRWVWKVCAARMSASMSGGELEIFQSECDDWAAYKWSHSGSKIGIQCESVLPSFVWALGFDFGRQRRLHKNRKTVFLNTDRSKSINEPDRTQAMKSFHRKISSENSSKDSSLSSHHWEFKRFSLRISWLPMAQQSELVLKTQLCNVITYVHTEHTERFQHTWNSKDKD